MLGKQDDTSEELPHILGAGSVMGWRVRWGQRQATVDFMVGGQGAGMVAGAGAGWGQAEQSLCQRLGVLNAPQTLQRKEQPVNWTLWEPGQPPLQLWLSSSAHPCSDCLLALC